MGLKQMLVDAGKRFYNLAHEKQFIQGRSITLVAAVCLYMACRVDKNAPYLLIDFADAIQTNMY